MMWLRFEKRCMFIINERSPLYNMGIPDVLGVTRSRETTEVEIKRSMSDFRANANKRCVVNRHLFLDRWPKQFYFAMPEKLASRVQFDIPEWAGLLSVRGTNQVEVLLKAPINRQAKKLTIKQCAHFAELMANQIIAQQQSLECKRESMIDPSHLDEIHAKYYGERQNGFSNYQI